MAPPPKFGDDDEELEIDFGTEKPVKIMAPPRPNKKTDASSFFMRQTTMNAPEIVKRQKL